MDTKIVSAKIHPSIGVARVGNAKDAFYYGPEVTYPDPKKPGFYRDDTGALKREAARFRVYGYNAAGEVVSELQPDEDVTIDWTVRLANLKASWYAFQIALDIPEAKSAQPTVPRNLKIEGSDRKHLEICPSPITISGTDTSGPAYEFSDGRFFETPVSLGELQTDKDGRLIVLGGHGVSAGHDGAPLSGFANNDNWHDDVGDGPVTACVTIGGEKISVDPAWVVIAPPNYAPNLKTVRTLYDLLTDVFITSGQLPKPSEVSFQNDILPIFERMTGLGWVNVGFSTAFGPDGWLDFTDPDLLKRLSTITRDSQGNRLNTDANSALRHQIANMFRDYEKDSWSQSPFPWIYGDAMNVPAAHVDRQNTMLAQQQIDALDKWGAGNFVEDYDPNKKHPQEVEKLPIADQPAMLDRAALDFCLADAFHPGCEVTWPIRTASMFSEPYRILHRAADNPPPEMEPVLDPDSINEPGGILYGQNAGWMSRWMAVPWQADTASCRSGYDRAYDPYLPTFWPARVPNHVMSPQDLEAASDPNSSPEDRLRAFRSRIKWIQAGLGFNPATQLQNMVDGFGDMGVVEVHDVESSDPSIPKQIQAADRPLPTPASNKSMAQLKVNREVDSDPDLETPSFGRFDRFRN